MANALGEVDAVAQALLPIVDIVNGLAARTDVTALVHGGKVTDLARMRCDAL